MKKIITVCDCEDNEEREKIYLWLVKSSWRSEEVIREEEEEEVLGEVRQRNSSSLAVSLVACVIVCGYVH